MHDSTRPARRIVHLPGSEYAKAIRECYAAGTTPWDSGRPSSEVVKTVEEGGLPGKHLLELGCGTGTNAVELARRGYRVTAVDLVPEAVEKGRAKAQAAHVNVDFRVGDLTRIDLGGPYESVLDLGVYHGIRNRDLEGFLAALTRVSRKGTRWLSLAGNAKEIREAGPPVVSEGDIRRELEPLFEILRLREFRFDLAPDFQPLAWSILLARR